MKSVYQIPQKINSLTDHRQRKSIPFFNIIMPVFLILTLQYESFHMVFSSENMQRKLKNCIKGRIPKVDAVRAVLEKTDPDEVRQIHETVIDQIYRNRVFRGGTIDGFLTVGIDGVELFNSTKKSGPNSLTRKNKAGEKEYFYRSVVCMTVGESPHVIIGQEMLKPRDGGEKDEGELTGGKRLIKRLRKRHGHFADVIVADALYLNAPFINTVLECRMDTVIRLKDERREIFKDAEKLFQKDEGKKRGFHQEKKEIEVWDLSDFPMEGVEKKVRVLRFKETWKEKGAEKSRMMWVVTTLETADYRTIWKMMNKRWDIEENGFHQLKTYYHAKHCYCQRATEVIFNLMILAFNMREMYLYRRVKGFKESKMTRKDVSQIFRDDLLLESQHEILYGRGG